MTGFVDVHTHLTHTQFDPDRPQVIAGAVAAGLKAIVVNGLEPRSNRQILEMASQYPEVKAALGIYPVDAVADLLPLDFPLAVTPFDVWQEVAFIREQAKAGTIVAVGECGLDGHWLGPDTFAQQERVFEALLEVAMDHGLPVIIHTRKLEQRAMEILLAHGTRKVNFHCFGGKTRLALEAAERHDWFFSIPANANVNQAFQKMLKLLPQSCILTETDAPYLGPVRNARNVPANVVSTIHLLANLRGWTEQQAQEVVWNNYLRLFAS